ncbi:r-opsin [Paragonimus westermani]|uniref:R-opsin n=1 Tax=Paragonimus westermani TaxID=34504 RepID=A0A5J4NBN0_9TREM|nr:r-opsin [Paragonimus westermani]
MAAWIHPHWHKYTQPDPMLNYIIGVYMALVGVVGVTGNLIVIILFTTSVNLRSVANTLIVNLAVSDLAFTLLMGFPIKTLAAFNQFWGWGKRACELYGFAGGFLGFASLTTLAFIALDRYLAVIHPLQSQPRLQSGSRVSKFLLMIWLWALTWSIPPFFGYGSYRLEGFHTSCTFDYLSTDVPNVLFNAGMYIFAFLMPLGMLAFCYYGIVHKLQGNKRSLRNFSSQRAMDRLRASKLDDLFAFAFKLAHFLIHSGKAISEVLDS